MHEKPYRNGLQLLPGKFSNMEMMKKKILVLNMGTIYPVRAMNQMRTHNMMRVLSSEYVVDLATTANDEEEQKQSLLKMQEIGGKYIYLGTVKPKNNILKKRLIQLLERVNYYLSGRDFEVTSNKFLEKKILEAVNAGSYDAVISNYWESSLFFLKLNGGIKKILDPHYSVAENFDVLAKNSTGGLNRFFELRRLNKNKELEQRVIEASDATIPLSQRNFDEFDKIDGGKPKVLVADGNDLDYFFEYKPEPDPKTILFYGAMSSKQNVEAFFRLYNNILPELKKKIPALKLLVVGSKPIPAIQELHNGGDVVVTGFVDDVRPYISKAWLSMIPLNHGSGFRGRVVELLALGVPVIGTHNALDSVAMENEVNGFISDDDQKMTEYALTLFENAAYRKQISENSVKFVKETYSLEATFGRLLPFLNELFKGRKS